MDILRITAAHCLLAVLATTANAQDTYAHPCSVSLPEAKQPYVHMKPRFISTNASHIKAGAMSFYTNISNGDQTVPVRFPSKPVIVDDKPYRLLSCHYASPSRPDMPEPYDFWLDNPPSLQKCDIEAIVSGPMGEDKPKVRFEKEKTWRGVLVDIKQTTCPQTAGEARRLSMLPASGK